MADFALATRGLVPVLALRYVGMTILLRLGVACLVLHGCATRTSPSAPRVVAEAETRQSIQRDEAPAEAVLPARDPRREVRDALLSTVRAALTDLDVERYVAGWVPEGESVGGRGPERGPYDLQLDLRRIRAMRGMAAGRDPKRRVEVEGEQVLLQRDRATVSWVLNAHAGSSSDSFGERYELVRTDRAWKIVRYRYWPIAHTEDGERFEFGSLWFAAADAAVEAVRAQGDRRQLVWKLFGAYRFLEALDEARRLTTSEPLEPWNWSIRAQLARLVGEGDEAESCFREQERLVATQRLAIPN